MPRKLLLWRNKRQMMRHKEATDSSGETIATLLGIHKNTILLALAQPEVGLAAGVARLQGTFPLRKPACFVDCLSLQG